MEVGNVCVISLEIVGLCGLLGLAARCFFTL